MPIQIQHAESESDFSTRVAHGRAILRQTVEMALTSMSGMGHHGFEFPPNTVSGDIDTDFVTDGSSWLITLNQVGNHAVPYWGIPANTMNSQFKFRINFHSNAAGTNIGHWMEDIVMFYDQKARAEEFAISANSGSSGHAQAGEWAETTISLSNAGNLSDSVELSVSNLPAGWSHRFQHMTGSQIPDGSRLDLSKGETKTIKLLVQPSEGSAMGSTSVNVHAHSTESTVSAMTTASFIVDPGYQPAWVEQDPSFSCAPEMHVISKSRLETW